MREVMSDVSSAEVMTVLAVLVTIFLSERRGVDVLIASPVVAWNGRGGVLT